MAVRPCVVLALAVLGCRGNTSSEPPVHLNPNMDKQERYMAQEKNSFYEDKRAMRPSVPGTIAVGELREDDHLNRGLVDGAPATTLPLKLSKELLERGRARFDIYCRVCHGGSGIGDGIVTKRGMLPPPSFHDARPRGFTVGQIFQVISNGVRNMPSYATQIPVRDRWAIVTYVRALQVSRNATLEDIPKDIAASKGWSK